MNINGESEREGDNARRNVSIVDDDPSVRKATASLCESAGYNPRTFETAESFLESGVASDCDCLILDLQLPGMSGMDLLEELLRNNHQFPVLMVTANQDPKVKRLALDNGVFCFLIKMKSDENLLDEIVCAVEGAQRHF